MAIVGLLAQKYSHVSERIIPRANGIYYSCKMNFLLAAFYYFFKIFNIALVIMETFTSWVQPLASVSY